MNLAQHGNYYFDRKQPWNLIKSDKEKCSTALNICLSISNALAVFMSGTAFFGEAILSKVRYEREQEK